MKTAKETAEFIELLVKKKGIPVIKLLSDCELSDRVISNMKSGSMPSADKLVKIASYLEVSVEYLTGDEQNITNTFDNRSISGGTVFQATSNSGTLNINGNQKELSSEAMELLRIFESLDVKKRHKLMDMAFKLEDEVNSKNLKQ